MTNEITVFIEGGAIQEIVMPEDTVVTVVDWDIDGGDEEELTLYDGERAYVSKWYPPGAHKLDCDCGDYSGEDKALEQMESGISDCERMFEPDWNDV